MAVDYSDDERSTASRATGLVPTDGGAMVPAGLQPPEPPPRRTPCPRHHRLIAANVAVYLLQTAQPDSSVPFALWPLGASAASNGQVSFESGSS
jgi:hypothetical protein